jgi:hypothetical protein
LESSTVSGQVKPSARMDVGISVKSFHPESNKVVLSNGKEYTYKCLIVNTGFDHSAKHIDGLKDFESEIAEKNQVYVHEIDEKPRLLRNYYHGWFHHNGDMIVYAPKAPYKGEGTDFYAFYYEHINRFDKL